MNSIWDSVQSETRVKSSHSLSVLTLVWIGQLAFLDTAAQVIAEDVQCKKITSEKKKFYKCV